MSLADPFREWETSGQEVPGGLNDRVAVGQGVLGGLVAELFLDVGPEDGDLAVVEVSAGVGDFDDLTDGGDARLWCPRCRCTRGVRLRAGA